MTEASSNGHDGSADPGDLDDLDDDAPLDADEAAAGSAAAGETADESLDERVGSIVEELDGVTRRPTGDEAEFAVGARLFAVVGAERLEVALDPAVARAAVRTPDTRASLRGAGWITFEPAVTDRFALDRAEAWVRLAHRRAGGRPG